MDELSFTVRKQQAFIPIAISDHLLDDLRSGPPPRPTFRWPSFVCGYEHNDDYYTEGHACELPVGHDGPHRCSLEWETRPSDICRAQGHEPGEWVPYVRDASTMMTPALQVKSPTKRTRCTRCDAWLDDGE